MQCYDIKDRSMQRRGDKPYYDYMPYFCLNVLRMEILVFILPVGMKNSKSGFEKKILKCSLKTG